MHGIHVVANALRKRTCSVWTNPKLSISWEMQCRTAPAHFAEIGITFTGINPVKDSYYPLELSKARNNETLQTLSWSGDRCCINLHGPIRPQFFLSVGITFHFKEYLVWCGTILHKFGCHLSCFFSKIQNQSAAGNVIQLNKKINLTPDFLICWITLPAALWFCKIKNRTSKLCTTFYLWKKCKP